MGALTTVALYALGKVIWYEACLEKRTSSAERRVPPQKEPQAQTGSQKPVQVHSVVKSVVKKAIEAGVAIAAKAQREQEAQAREERETNLAIAVADEAQKAGSLCSDLSTAPSLNQFFDELETEIFPYYEAHERGFDKAKIHGRMHAARAVLFAEVMGRYWVSKGKGAINFMVLRRVTALHDSGREDNGRDIYEKISAKNIAKHLMEKGMSKKSARYYSRIVVHDDKHHVRPLETMMFQSADCLDIMRPCCGIWREKFKPNVLSFLKGSQDEGDIRFRNALIEEAWKFIQLTENDKFIHKFMRSQGFMEQLLGYISKADFPILYKYLIEPCLEQSTSE